MEELKELNDNVRKMMEQFTGLSKTVGAIDLSIRGDDSRGVMGMKQHMQTLQENLKEHTENDTIEFQKLNKTKNILWGIVLGVPTISGIVVWLVQQLSK